MGRGTCGCSRTYRSGPPGHVILDAPYMYSAYSTYAIVHTQYRPCPLRPGVWDVSDKTMLGDFIKLGGSCAPPYAAPINQSLCRL